MSDARDSDGQDSDGQDREPQLLVVQAVPGTAEKGQEQDAGAEGAESVERPAKVMRIGSMTRQLLEEARQAPLDEAGRARLAEIYDTSLHELREGLSPELVDELGRMVSPFVPGSVPSESELRVAQAQLVGWLEGLFAGIQATLYAQQMAQRAQLEDARRRGLPTGRDREERPMPGTYL
jgi:Bacterial proteasome activator